MTFDKEKLKAIKQAEEEWAEKVVKPLIAKRPERKEKFMTDDGFEIKRVYTPADLGEDWDYLEKLGFPGQYPFTRGVYGTMYRGRFWTMRQYAGFGTAEESNKRYKYLLSQGQTGLSVAFDLPTQIGYDSDHPMSEGEVGKVGVAIDSLWDMRILFDGIPLDKVSTSMTINSTAANLLAMYILVAEEQGVKPEQLRGTVQNDILKEYIARGTYIFPPQPSMRLTTDIIMYCAEHVPKWNPISISGYHIREAGANAVQEVAFTLADGIEYVKAVIERGMDVDKFAGRLSFFFNAHNNFLEEIAKFRAARRLWAYIMKEWFNAKNPKSMLLRFHTQTAGSTLTAQQPENNIVRVAIQALAAVLGGTQSLHTNSYDEALSLPTEKSVRIALRTQQIIAYESGVVDTIDPLGGAYYIEWLTDHIYEEALKYIEKIQKMGGMMRAIERGYIQKEIAESAYKFQKEVEEKKRIIVGVNEFIVDEPLDVEILKVDPSIREKQIERLKKLRSERDNKKVEEALDKLRNAAEKEDENLMPYIIEAHRHLATLGEVTDVLREVWGEYRAPLIF
ncbi:methylmalonyl-CoA mutase [Thermococcus sp. GR7]|uniref:acyl-CoA mutase large subunit family protein n=1 Tax=unclassified Thermococcus TaxID=2627626 RepID=UPI0014311424|nr:MULTISPECIES: methylmalonyl-CoA mutase family protein [unclassified Thermococcus]NJE47443.1 methylmalonyl-CoA mutase [Thermococcus sp. GR7]NJE79260.1 methylmalonyl-CoA mutase [Thermococcus sp. GR4]NJF23493.1 methylmalonyl-CoA mutase [Thermococcus sp. GR5]